MKRPVFFGIHGLALAAVIAVFHPAQYAAAQIGSAVAPIVTVRATDPYASEICGAITIVDPGKFTFYRTGPTNYSLKVFYSVSGTASNGMDYTKLTGVMEIPTNRWSADVYVSPFCDNLVEPTESVKIRLQPVTNTTGSTAQLYLVGQPCEATAFIRDWGWPPYVRILQPTNGQSFKAPANVHIAASAVDPQGYIYSMQIREGTNVIGSEARYYLVPPTNGSPFLFQMTWTNVPLGRHTITAYATDNQGITGASEPVTFFVGAPPPCTNRPPVVTIVATDPIAIEGTNCWPWPSPTNRWPVGTTNTCALRPGSSVMWWWFTNCGPKEATFAVRRMGDTNQELHVKYEVGGTATNGVDYDPLPGFVTIPAGARKAEILIVPKSDPHPDPIKTVIIRLIPPLLVSNVAPPYFVGYPNKAGAIIVDSDSPWPGPQPTADRCFVLRQEAADRDWFRIDASTDLLHWSPICSAQAIQGAIYFIDSEAQDNPSRFYRAVPELAPPQD